MLCPVLHGHCLFTLCLTFRKIQIPGYKLSHSTKFFFIQIVFRNNRFFECRLITCEGSQSHKLFFRIRSCINHFCRSLSVNGIMNFILNLFEKTDRDFRFRVIVNAGGIDFKHLAIKNTFSDARMSLILSSSSLKYPPLPRFFNRSSSMAKPFFMYSLRMLVAQILNCVPRLILHDSQRR